MSNFGTGTTQGSSSLAASRPPTSEEAREIAKGILSVEPQGNPLDDVLVYLSWVPPGHANDARDAWAKADEERTRLRQALLAVRDHLKYEANSEGGIVAVVIDGALDG